MPRVRYQIFVLTKKEYMFVLANKQVLLTWQSDRIGKTKFCILQIYKGKT